MIEIRSIEDIALLRESEELECKKGLKGVKRKI